MVKARRLTCSASACRALLSRSTPQFVQQPSRALGEAFRFGEVGQYPGVGLQGLPDRPAAHVLDIADGRGVHQGQGGLQGCHAGLACLAFAGNEGEDAVDLSVALVLGLVGGLQQGGVAQIGQGLQGIGILLAAQPAQDLARVFASPRTALRYPPGRRAWCAGPARIGR